MDDRPRYMISVAAEFVGMHPQTLRVYETKGLVRPRRTPGNTRLYSEADLERLRLIQRLTTELGLNLAGVETVLRLQDELGRLQARLDRLERDALERLAASAAAAALVAVGVTGFFAVSGQNQRPRLLDRVGRGQNTEAADLRALHRLEISSRRQPVRPQHIQIVRAD